MTTQRDQMPDKPMIPDQQAQAALEALTTQSMRDGLTFEDVYPEHVETIRAALTRPAETSGVREGAVTIDDAVQETIWHDKYHELCEQCWKALGITEYTGKHIAQHIMELRDVAARGLLNAPGTKWLPIETAPKDGTDILIATRQTTSGVQWVTFKDKAFRDYDYDHYHDARAWMTLPQPPALTEKK